LDGGRTTPLPDPSHLAHSSAPGDDAGLLRGPRPAPTRRLRQPRITEGRGTGWRCRPRALPETDSNCGDNHDHGGHPRPARPGGPAAAAPSRHRPVTRRRSRRPAPATAVRRPVGAGSHSTSPRVRPGPLWPLPRVCCAAMGSGASVGGETGKAEDVLEVEQLQDDPSIELVGGAGRRGWIEVEVVAQLH
jgi:hypothetical protein